MTNSPQFEHNELRLIVDALVAHKTELFKLYRRAQHDAAHKGRIDELSALIDKAVALRESME